VPFLARTFTSIVTVETNNTNSVGARDGGTFLPGAIAGAPPPASVPQWPRRVNERSARGMSTVSERLREARERTGLSLRELSARTKIRTPLLDAIERADFGRIPQGLLARGFLRAYAREVGLDPESIVRQFQDEYESETRRPDALPAATASVDSEQQDHNDCQSSGRLHLRIVASVAALIGVVFIFVQGRSEVDDRVPSDPIPTVRADAEVAAGPGHDAEPTDDPVPADVVAAVRTFENNADVLNVAIAPADAVWVEATADGTRVLYELLRPGLERSIDVRDELLLRVGDAGAFQYSINGMRGRLLGPPGAVRTFRITRENYRTFQDQ
jgi:cytoskeleton protein RodZ